MCVQILVNNRIIPTYNHQLNSYIEGRPGSEYTIRYTNNSSYKRKVVISVDGLNVITGDTNFDSGYVVDGLATIDIEGWRKDKNTVAKFKFGSRKNSYNLKNENGVATSIGVIGVKEYDQQIKINVDEHLFGQRDIYPKYLYQSPWIIPLTPYNPSPNWLSENQITSSSISVYKSSTSNKTSMMNIGTEWGDEKQSIVEPVQNKFKEIVACPPTIIYYDDSKGLRARGIVIGKKTEIANPNPFPQTKFCQEPT